MSDWVPTEVKWGSRKAIKYKKTQELDLYGPYGAIWKYNDEFFSAVITSPKVANKVTKKYGRRGGYKDGEELVIKFPKKDLNEMIRTLKIPKSCATQIRYAENFPDGIDDET